MTELEFQNVKQKAELGENYYEFELASCYLNGQFVEQNDCEAFAWYKKSSDHGNSYASGNVGWCYEYGRGVELNLNNACYYYVKAFIQMSNKNNDWTSGRLTAVKDSLDLTMFTNEELISIFDDTFGPWGCFSNIFDDKQKYQICCVLCEKEYGDAYYQMASYYAYTNSVGINKDLEQAFQYLVKGAQLENPKCLYEIIDKYAKRCSQEDILCYSAMLFTYGDNNQKAKASYILYEAYRYGHGVKIDDKEAFYWANENLKCGDTRPSCLFYANDMVFIANCYLNGIGTDKNILEAYKYLEKALDAYYPSFDAKITKSEVEELLEQVKLKINN